MVKTIRVPLDDTEYSKFINIKGNRTWSHVLKVGISVLRDKNLFNQKLKEIGEINNV